MLDQPEQKGNGSHGGTVLGLVSGPTQDVLGPWRSVLLTWASEQVSQSAGQTGVVMDTSPGPPSLNQFFSLKKKNCHLWLDQAQIGIKIAGRNINNLRYADDTTLMAESEELKSLLMKLKEANEKLA